jgi:hypothetical protein
MNDNFKIIKIDSHSKITYIEKIELLKNNYECNNIYFDKIEKLFKKLAYFKTTTINNSIYNLESKNKSFLTELNIYIQCFINELQLPLSTICNGFNILLQNYINSDDPQLENNINIIINLDKIVKYIINSFTKFIDIHNGHICLNNFEPFSIEYLFIKIETVLSNDFDEKNIKFKYIIDENIIDWFIGDVYNITNILNKLIKNAIKYSDSNRNNCIFINAISSDLTINKKKIIITVSDTNNYISSEIKDNLFNSTNNSGLYICKTILELHNGYITHDFLDIIGNKFTINLELEIYSLNNKFEKVKKGLDANIKNNKLNKNLSNEYLLNLFEDKINTNKYNIMIINNKINERLLIYKTFKINKNFNNIYSFGDGLDAICKIYNNLESIDIILIDIDLINNNILYMNGLVTSKLLRGLYFNKLIFAIYDENTINDNSFDYIFIKPFDKNQINLLFDFININGVTRQFNKTIKLVNQKLEWSYLFKIY